MQAFACDSKYLRLNTLCEGCLENEKVKVLEQLKANYSFLHNLFTDMAAQCAFYPHIDL